MARELLSMRSWPFWPNKREALEERWRTTLHPPAWRWLKTILLPISTLASVPFVYEWILHVNDPAPSFEDVQRIANGDAVQKWWKAILAQGVLKGLVEQHFLEGTLTSPRSIDRIHEVSYLHQEEDPASPDGTPIASWRHEQVFMTVVTDIERTIEFVPDPVKTPEEEDIEAYNEMVRLTLDPWWYSTAYHEISSARLTHEFLDQRVQMRKNLLMRQTKMWNVEDDTPYLYHWQMQLADKLLMPPSPLWVPTKRVVPLLPDDAMRLTTTFEITSKNSEPRFVAATLCPRLVATKEEDQCLTLTTRAKKTSSFVWWQNWDTLNSAGRECSGTMLRFDYSGVRGVRDGRLLRGSRFPRLPVGVQGWEGTPIVRDDAVYEVVGPDAHFLKSQRKMQEQWLYEHDMLEASESTPAEQLIDEGQPFTGDYMDVNYDANWNEDDDYDAWDVPPATPWVMWDDEDPWMEEQRLKNRHDRNKYMPEEAPAFDDKYLPEVPGA